MKFKNLYNKIIREDNLAGSGDVFGPGSISTEPDMQGDHIYNPGQARIATGRVSMISRKGKLKRKNKK